MRLPSYVRTALVTSLLLLTYGPARAVNGIDRYPVFPEPYGFAAIRVLLGWYNGTQAWHFCIATNSISEARTPAFNGPATLSPKLSSALTPKIPGGEIAARPMYRVTNFQNPPVFSAAPGDLLYSALWQVFNVTWRPGATPRPITNADPASAANPTGLPGPAEADIVPTQVVVDCPIVVLGPLACPGSENVPGYIIPQAEFSTNAYDRFVFLPAWLVYCQDPITRRTFFAVAQMTDVSHPDLAALVGANLAPGLLNLPDSDTTDFFIMRGPKPLTQLPVLSACPSDVGFRNTNYAFSPVTRYVILRRNIPPYALVKTPDYIRLLLTSGGLAVLRDDQRANGGVFSID